MNARPPRLDDSAVAARLGELPGWRIERGRLARDYEFADFAAAFAFMTGCALEAEDLDHHPDWSNSWNRVQVRLQTHDRKGLTELDFELARRMEARYGPADCS